MNQKIYKTIDLFAGIGGIRRGYELTGRFKNVLSAEIDKYACITYEYIYGENPYNDVTSQEFKKKVENINYDILLGGFPCQAFSIAGLKKGFEDKTRGTLFFDIAQILKISKPKAFLLENVEGLLNHDKGNTFQIIMETLDELGYKVVGVDKEQTLLNKKFIGKKENLIRTPQKFGIPQKRARIFLMGFKKEDIPSNYNFPKLPENNNLTIYKDLNDLIEKKVEPKYYLSQTNLQTLINHKNRHQKKSSGFGYIVVNDQKSPLNIEGIRYMTPTEWGKLQGFINYAFIDEDGKDNFKFPENISNTQRYKLFGNSVCIPIIESMAKYMIKRLEEFYEAK